MNEIRPARILLVEDNPADVDLTREALEANKLHIDLSVVGDGMEAKEYLAKHGLQRGDQRPDLILLDLNLPRLDGRGLLKFIREQENLRTIPIVVLTSSEAESDVLQSYDLGANCYIAKPINISAFQSIMSAVEDFWFTVVKLPPGEVRGSDDTGEQAE